MNSLKFMTNGRFFVMKWKHLFSFTSKAQNRANLCFRDAFSSSKAQKQGYFVFLANRFLIHTFACRYAQTLIMY